MKINFIIYIILIIPLVLSEKFRFDNYTLYKILPENISQIKLLQDLQDSDLRYDFWTDPTPSADFVNILSKPEYKGNLESFLNGNGINFEITMPNIQEAIDKETVKSYTRGDIRSMQWNGYYTNDQINAWMDDLAAAYPAIVTPLVGGTSYEGRPIRGLRISHGDGKRVVFLEGGIHSREWISPATVCYITNELLTSDDEETRAAARDFDWYIFPVTNPDGYIWSHDQIISDPGEDIGKLLSGYTKRGYWFYAITDRRASRALGRKLYLNKYNVPPKRFRLWRKNRRPIGSDFGIDLNRNWNNNWLVVGSSINPASDTYAGSGPFSEPETRDLSNFIRSIGDKIDLYLSFHSYSQLLLLPFGNSSLPQANYHEAMNIGRRAMGALSVRYGTTFVTGNIAEAIYEATGGSIDWVKEQLHVPLVYCYELRDRGQYGFLLPEDQILPSGQETMDSLLEMIHQAKRFGIMNAGSGVKASGGIIAFIVMAVVLY